MATPEPTKRPAIPAEIRVLIWNEAIEPVTLAPWDGTCFPRPEKPLLDIDDLFQTMPAPEEYPQLWESLEHWREYHDCNDACQRMLGRDANREAIFCQKPTTGRYCWSCRANAKGIMYLNREISKEAVEVLYSKTTFSFEHGHELVSFIRRVRSHDHQGFVKNLKLDLGFAKGQGDLEYFFPLLKSDAMKRAFPNLKTVTIKIAKGSFKSREGLRSDWFADAVVWSEVEGSLRDIADAFSGFDDLKVVVDGLASDELAGWLAEGAKSNLWLDRPLDPVATATQAAKEWREVNGWDYE